MVLTAKQLREQSKTQTVEIAKPSNSVEPVVVSSRYIWTFLHPDTPASMLMECPYIVKMDSGEEVKLEFISGVVKIKNEEIKNKLLNAGFVLLSEVINDQQ